MIRNYLKIAIRNISRHKGYSLINILGLTIGISCACLLFLFIRNETNFDKFHGKAQRMYRVVEVDDNDAERTRYYGMTAPPLGKALVEEYPEVVESHNMYQFTGHVNFVKDGIRYAERKWFYVESNFFEVFDFELVKGDKATALADPSSIVLSESAAEKYFGDEDPIGKTLTEVQMGDNDLTVTGVVKNSRDDSHLDFDVLIAGARTDDSWVAYQDRWDRWGAYTYVVLEDKADIVQLNAKIPDFVERHWGDLSFNRSFYLQPVTDIYFHANDVEFTNTNRKGDIFYVYLFAAIGIFLLAIASINYMNLATARSMQRAKEIGLRKVSGAFRTQLIFQFLSESILIALIAFVLSVGLVDISLPYFNDITGKNFDFNFQTIGDFLVILFAIAVIIGIISGSYPAFYLSRLRPSQTLKGELKLGKGNVWLRQGLVITQFSLSTIMIISTLAVYKQMNYISDKRMGFDKENMLVVDINDRNVRRSFETMKIEFLKVPGVTKVAASSRVPGEWKNINEVILKPESANSQDSLQSHFMCFDEHMLDTYKMSLTLGDNFSGILATDSTNILLNETAASTLGWDNPIGRSIYLNRVPYPLTVIGVVKDFHFQSLHQEVAPLMIGFWSNPVRPIDYFSLKIESNDIQATMAAVTDVHEQFDETTPMEYHFLDEQIDLFYKSDTTAGRLFGIGAVLTIFIACLGLFGLAAFVIQKRTKEISVRKVLGATVSNLFFTLSKTFIIQVLVAFVIAVPVAYFLMNSWLNYFAYKVSLGVDIFLMAGLSALILTIITISYRAIKAALLNPADTLKAE
ncbi:MAG: ABC transporter permease [Bacteroidota bacterium]